MKNKNPIHLSTDQANIWYLHQAPEWDLATQGLSPWAYSEVFIIPAADAWTRFGVLHLSLPEIIVKPEKIKI